MFATQTRDLSHIELERSDNISSSSKARTYRVNGVDISTKRKNKSKNRRIFPFTLALSVCNMGLGLAHNVLTGQMRCSHLVVFFKFSTKDTAPFLACFFTTYFLNILAMEAKPSSTMAEN